MTRRGQSVTLVPNPSFRGSVTPKVARIDLVPPGDQPIAEVGGRLDVAILAPTTADRGPIRELERKDFTVNTSHDGTAWALLLNPAGIFTSQPARVAFIRAASAAAMVERGSGLWSSAYTGTTSMLSAPGSRAYDIVNEDSGFAVALGTPSDDPAREREAAGVSGAVRGLRALRPGQRVRDRRLRRSSGFRRGGGLDRRRLQQLTTSRPRWASAAGTP